ncbi:uncharacterized protein LOC143940054 [Lithobates pipiens]
MDPVVYLQFLERQAEREAAERRAEREAAERQAEREADRRHELEMARLQQQRQAQNLGSLEHRDDSLPVTPAAKFPVMEKDSDIDVYLLSFEKTCRQYHLPPAQWARYLTPGLRGKALDAYVELSEEQGGDYEALKAAIIQKFQLTPEVYRKRFRSLQKGPGDSYLDVVSRLRTTFRQWTKGLKDDSFESLEDLMIEDQLLHICPTDVRQFVLERKPTSAKAAAELADTYIHSRVSDHRKAPPNGWKGGKSHMATPPLPTNQVPQRPEPAAPGAKAFVTENRKCYNCGKGGHLRTQCPEQKKMTTPGHPASNPSAVLLVSGKPPGTNANLQPVIVGQRTVTGFRDTGAEVTLVRPGVIEETDIIPEKYLTLTGVGGTCFHIPRAYVFLDWGAGSGMREVGVSEEIPTAALLGSDLGTLVSYYAPAKSTQDAPTELSGPTKRVAVDIVGPLAIPSSSGKHYILTVVDYATRYPEAVALSCLRTDKVADALLGIFTKMGFPAELISDQGPQFVSDLMQALCQQIQMTHIMASPYHPQTNGLCERFNGTLKQMLQTFVHSQGKDWERDIRGFPTEVSGPTTNPT